MKQLQRYTCQDVVNSFGTVKRRDEMHNQWIVHVLYRPISFRLSPIFINLGFRPSHITATSLALTFALPILLFTEQPLAIWLLALAMGLFQILDCIDGDIARTKQLGSKAGAYFDFLTDVIHRCVTYTMIGIFAGTQSTASLLPQLELWAIGAALLMVTAKMCRDHIKQVQNSNETIYELEKSETYTWFSYLFFFFSSLDHILPFLLVFSMVFGGLEYTVLWLFCYSLLDFLFTQFTIWQTFK